MLVCETMLICEIMYYVDSYIMWIHILCEFIYHVKSCSILSHVLY